MLRRNAGTLSMKADIREETSDETGLANTSVDKRWQAKAGTEKMAARNGDAGEAEIVKFVNVCCRER